MALPSQVDAALRVHRRPVGLQVFDRQIAVMSDDDMAGDREDAAQYVKRLGNRHDCTGAACTHPRHAADVTATNQALILAGLAPDPVPSVDRNRRMSRNVVPTSEALRAAKLREREARQPHTPAPDRSWRNDAACRTADPELFFPLKNDSGDALAAKAICRGCTVREACLDYAVNRPERFGIYGGLDEDERRTLRRRRRNTARPAEEKAA